MFGMRLLLLSGIEFCRSCYVVMHLLLFRLLRRLCLCAFAYLYPVVLIRICACSNHSLDLVTESLFVLSCLCFGCVRLSAVTPWIVVCCCSCIRTCALRNQSLVFRVCAFECYHSLDCIFLFAWVWFSLL